MYDLSGMKDDDKDPETVINDWKHLVDDLKLHLVVTGELVRLLLKRQQALRADVLLVFGQRHRRGYSMQSGGYPPSCALPERC